MNMKGICFKEPLFQSTIAGVKTQTRRIFSKQIDNIRNVNRELFSEKPNGIFKKQYDPICPVYSFPMADGKCIKPKYNVEEIIYLKEPYVADCIHGHIVYKYNKSDIELLENAGFKDKMNSVGFWQNKLFMPKAVARYFIVITDVHAERLQEISDEDCIKEGIYQHFSGKYWMNDIEELMFDSPKYAYKSLINHINGKLTWERNPYVWVYDYVLI